MELKFSLLAGCLGLTLLPMLGAKPEPFDTLQPLYREQYRPQYHYTPAHRWIGDPSGLIKHDGKYLAYCWGAAETEDLVHWKELNDHAIKEVPKGISCFTGSVVADPNNTAGYGEDALVAVFTSFNQETKNQSQSIAGSRDGGRTFEFHPSNPVLDIGSTEFRDPTVIWDANNNQWVMAVAKALEKKVAFYTSPDLKTWTWASDFGPAGNATESWECPDIFQVEVEGEPGKKKWVLLVSVNWRQEQYFVGEFDGKTFIPDERQEEVLWVDHGMDYYASRVFQTPEDPDAPVYTLGWVNTWEIANEAPTTYGKGIWSLPRRYTLYPTADGYRLRQRPAESLASLRQNSVSLKNKHIPTSGGFNSAVGEGNCYELEVEMTPLDNKPVEWNLMAKGDRKIRLIYNPSEQTLTLDRTKANNLDIPHFSRTVTHKVNAPGGTLKLNIFVDKSLLEIFVNDGEQVMTALVFPDKDQNKFFMRSEGPLDYDLTIHEMKSIW